jgi:hypothetical protein
VFSHDVDMHTNRALRGNNARHGRAQILHDSDLNAYDSFDDPDRVTIKPHPVAAEAGRIRHRHSGNRLRQPL